MRITRDNMESLRDAIETITDKVDDIADEVDNWLEGQDEEPKDEDVRDAIRDAREAVEGGVDDLLAAAEDIVSLLSTKASAKRTAAPRPSKSTLASQVWAIIGARKPGVVFDFDDAETIQLLRRMIAAELKVNLADIDAAVAGL